MDAGFLAAMCCNTHVHHARCKQQLLLTVQVSQGVVS
jgi:hypothetical protein